MEEETKKSGPNIGMIIAIIALVIAGFGAWMAYGAKNKAEENSKTDSEVAAQVQAEIKKSEEAAAQTAAVSLKRLEVQSNRLKRQTAAYEKQISLATTKATKRLQNQLNAKGKELSKTEQVLVQEMVAVHRSINRLNQRITVTNDRVTQLQARLKSEGV
jgi:chromosome segregation ATPase